jgi:hypothetical protein
MTVLCLYYYNYTYVYIITICRFCLQALTPHPSRRAQVFSMGCPEHGQTGHGAEEKFIAKAGKVRDPPPRRTLTAPPPRRER